MEGKCRFLLVVVLAVLTMVPLWTQTAQAVPSFARQTGMACSVCHIQFPELTPFGRSFKINAYTIATMPQIEVQQKIQRSGGLPPSEKTYLKINQIFPLSAMLQVSMTGTNKTLPGTQNYDVAFPQQLSLFLAGEITPDIGSFLQVTYSGEDDKFSFDNTDIRFAKRTKLFDKDTVYGLTLNNNPTVEDPWHDTPAWGFPWASSDAGPGPAAGALIDGALAQDVAGLGAYVLWDNHWYGDVTLYRSSHLGSGQPPDDNSSNTIDNLAPYWRLAWQQNWGKNYLEVGTFGLYAALYPNGISGDTDKYTDTALDFQYERTLANDDVFSLYGTYIYEHQNLEGSYAAGNADERSNHLNVFRLNGLYNLGKQVGFGLGYFLLKGSSNGNFYNEDQVLTRSGSPDTDGILGQVNYYPWENVRLSLQYTAYLKFNGASSNYDGTGRDAQDNNTTYLLAWFVW